MKDETLREALTTAAKAEPSAGDPFTRFESVRRRSAAARGAVLVGVGVLLVLSFAFVFPNPLRSGSPAEFPAGGELDPLPRDVRVYEDPVAGFQLEYPGTWRARGEHGRTVTFFVDVEEVGERDPHTDLFGAPEGYVREVPRTFYVEVTPDLPGNEIDAFSGREFTILHDVGAIITREDVVSPSRGQQRTDQARIIFGERPIGPRIRALEYWCSSCRMVELLVTLDPARGVPPLHVRIVAPDQGSFNEYLFDALPLLDSIERLPLGS